MRHREILTYAGQQFVQTHYTEWGDADNENVVCCVHGLTRNCRDFDELALALSDRFRVICVDIVGRGQSGRLDDAQQYNYGSYVNQLGGLLAHLNVQRLQWVGTSMGGILGTVLAAAPHTPITKMVISDVGPVIDKRVLQRIGEYLGKAPTFDSLAQVEKYLREVHSGFGNLSDRQWLHLAEHSSHEEAGHWQLNYDPAVASAFADISEDIDLTPVWQQVQCPLLVLRGADSEVLPSEVAEGIAQHPNVTLREFAGVGHAPMMMSADQIDVVSCFLSKEQT